jgi:hypothetical protein
VGDVRIYVPGVSTWATYVFMCQGCPRGRRTYLCARGVHVVITCVLFVYEIIRVRAMDMTGGGDNVRVRGSVLFCEALIYNEPTPHSLRVRVHYQSQRNPVRRCFKVASHLQSYNHCFPIALESPLLAKLLCYHLHLMNHLRI